jgi:hypothetical protein
MSIAVVGATGMLGQHVARHTLRAGHELIALYRNPRTLPGYVARKRNIVYAGTLDAGWYGSVRTGILLNPRRFLWPQPSWFRHGRFLSTGICTARFQKYPPVPLR